MSPPGSTAAVAGLFASSYFFFSNVGTAFFGVMPGLARVSLPVETQLALWSDYYGIAKKHMAAAAVVAAASLGTASYTTPDPTLRLLLASGAAASIAVPIFTLSIIMPINNDLLARQAKRIEFDTAEANLISDKLSKWRALHLVRIVLGAVSLVCASAAVLASEPVVHL